MSDWQVQVNVTVNVDDCADADEAELRVRRCLPHVKIPSVKQMRVMDVEKARLVVERRAARPAEKEQG